MVKKILFTSHTANFAKFNQAFMQDLRKKGYEVHYVSRGEEPIAGVDKNFVIPFARSPLALKKHILAYRELKDLLRKEKYDLIHTHTPVGSVLTRLAARKVRVKAPVIYTAHGFHFYRGAPVVNWLLYYPIEKHLSRWTDALVLINGEDYARAKKKFHTKVVEQIPGVGVDLGRFRPVDEATKKSLRKKHGLGAEDFVLVYVAEMNKNKDQGFLLDNLPKLAEEVPEVKLVLVGEGALKEKMEAKAKVMGLEKIVMFPGRRKDIEEWYQMADMVVSASQREGLGLNVIEGMACGLPAVIRDNRGHREIMQTGRGFLFRTGEEFRTAVADLYRDTALRQDIGQYNTHHVKRFALEKARAEMREIYEKFL